MVNFAPNLLFSETFTASTLMRLLSGERHALYLSGMGDKIFRDVYYVEYDVRIPSNCMISVGQKSIYTYIYTVCLVISKPKTPYVHRIYMVLANPMYDIKTHNSHQWYSFLAAPVQITS
jgi:hypothetical protein